jgi:hypothetical protein
MLHPVTRTYPRSDNLHSAEVDSTAEVEEGAGVISASAAIAADLQMIAVHSDLEIDHRRPQGGEVYLAATGTTGARRDAKMTAGSIVMIVSVSLIASDETLWPADSTHVRLLLTNKCHQRNRQPIVRRRSSPREMIWQCEDLRQHPCLELRSHFDVICRLKTRHRLCLSRRTTFWLAASSHRLPAMALVRLHHHRPHHKYLLLDLYHSNLSRTAVPHQTYGKPRLRTVLQQHMRNRQFRLHLQ